MEQFRKVQVVILFTKEKSKFGLIHESNKLHIYTNGENPNNLLDNLAMNQHLYIISDEKPGEGEWYYDTFHKHVRQASKIDLIQIGRIYFKKIVATTDLKLWRPSSKYASDVKHLPSPSQQFIEQYVKSYNAGNPITEVLVEYEEKTMTEIEKELGIYGHDEGLSQREYDEYSKTNSILKLEVNPDNTINIKSIKDSYSREEVIELLNKLNNQLNIVDKVEYPNNEITLEQWINKNL